jgi:hypothetical protein
MRNGLKRYTVKRLQGAEVRGRMQLMQASFDGACPDIPLPNLGSGFSRIHVLTFSLFNSFNASHGLSNSQCKFWDIHTFCE